MVLKISASFKRTKEVKRKEKDLQEVFQKFKKVHIHIENKYILWYSNCYSSCSNNNNSSSSSSCCCVVVVVVVIIPLQ